MSHFPVAALLFSYALGCVTADTVSVSAPADTHDTALLDGEYASWNFGGSPLLEVGFMGGIYAEHHAVTLLRFDLSGVPCREVSGAKIRLCKPRCFVQTTPLAIKLLAVARANAGWLEGSAMGAEDPGGASWVAAKVNHPWSGAPGCARAGIDFSPKPLDARTAPPDRGEWMEFALPAGLVQQWLDHPEDNAGVYLAADVQGSEWGQHVYFYSSEHYSGKGPQLVIEGTPGVARRPPEQTTRAKVPMALPPIGQAFEHWLRQDGRIARMTTDCRMTREQAQVFYYFDTQAREELLLPRYQRPLGRIFTRMNELAAKGDEPGVRAQLEAARKALLTWEYIRETSWYTSGPNADCLSPGQLGQLFSQTIFGKLEERNDEAGRERLRRSGSDPNEWQGTWLPLTGPKLEEAVQQTLQTTARKLKLTPEQAKEIEPALADARREENRYLTEFRKYLDQARRLAAQNADNAEMLQVVRGLHLNHERFLYYQSIYDTPRWSLFMQKVPTLPFAKWVAEVGKRYYPKPRSGKVMQAAARVRRSAADILPASALAEVSDHPLEVKIRAFLTNQAAGAPASLPASSTNEQHAGQAAGTPWEPTGLMAEDYLSVINGQMAVFRRCQDASGAIIDPVMRIEWQYSTPCYALSVALLHASGYNLDPGLLESGVKAMELSVKEMHEYRCAHNHGEFFAQPVMLALDLFEPFLPKEKSAEWRVKLADLDSYKLYPDNLQRKKTAYNHNLVALAGEYLRAKQGWPIDTNFFNTHLEHQRQYFTDLGMYKDPNVPMVYDEFSRQFVTTILCEGYGGSASPTPHSALRPPTPLDTRPCSFYRDRLWKGAWMSLFMQSPFGECPAGGRSAHHIWNEAQMAVTYEIYAAQYARHKDAPQAMAKAGAFKRAAHLSLRCIGRWLRPDGSGYIVKNRYPIEAKHGYERYSAQSQYNLLACWLMAVAYLYSDESIAERPAPADVGGFVVPLVSDFHKVFANAGGTYVEYDTAADLHYNPTGLIRVHVKNSNPQLGPSDGVVHQFDPKTKADLGGENLCIGPAWRDASGQWHRLADYSSKHLPTVEILREKPDEVAFRVTYEGDLDGARRVRETITAKRDRVIVEDSLEGPGSIRVYYPMLVFDGLEETRTSLSGNVARLSLRDGALQFSVDQPAGVSLQRAGRRLDFRSGQAEALYADVPGTTVTYSIRAAPASVTND